MFIIKILGIVGSKRKNGNTSTLVRQALTQADEAGLETDLVFLGDHSITGCTGCEGCRDTYRCVIDDDMQEIYPLLLDADAIVIGSPTYFYNVTADIKAFIDRCYCFDIFDEDDRSVWLSVNEALGGKYAVVIAVCEQYSVEDMGYTPEALSKPLEALGYRIVDKVNAFKLYEQGEALRDKQLLQQTASAGLKLVKTLKLRNKVEGKLIDRDL